MDTVSTISLYAALVTTGLMAGVYLAFSIAVLPGIARTDDDTFVSAMRGMNAAILNPVFGLVFGGPLVFGIVAVATRLPDGEDISSIGAALGLYVATLLITGGISVPLNNRLDSTEPPEDCARPLREDVGPLERRTNGPVHALVRRARGRPGLSSTARCSELRVLRASVTGLVRDAHFPAKSCQSGTDLATQAP